MNSLCPSNNQILHYYYYICRRTSDISNVVGHESNCYSSPHFANDITFIDQCCF